MRLFGLSLACLALLSTASVAAPKKAETQRFCPVFTDQRVYPSSRSERYHGIKIYFSSNVAARKFNLDPTSYHDVEILPQLKDLNVPRRQTRQEYCPVYPTVKISIRDPYVTYNGKRVYLSSERALQGWNLNPQKYVDFDILPQLFVQSRCPVYPNRPVFPNSPSVTYKGHLIFLSDEKAVEVWHTNPPRYANPFYLPQLDNETANEFVETP